jgi:hypothetical protein
MVTGATLMLLLLMLMLLMLMLLLLLPMVFELLLMVFELLPTVFAVQACACVGTRAASQGKKKTTIS